MLIILKTSSLKVVLLGQIDYIVGYRIMEISYKYFYSFIMTDQILSKLNSKKIDSFLSFVVDPLGRTFSISELVGKYNYPKEDVCDIDLDWW